MLGLRVSNTANVQVTGFWAGVVRAPMYISNSKNQLINDQLIGLIGLIILV